MGDEHAVLVGLDWADRKHDLCWRETETGKIHRLVLEHTPERINGWVSELIAKHPGQRIAVCLEQSRGPLIYALMGYAEVDLYPVNPATLADYRKAFRPSGAKDDSSDAAFLLDVLERHRDALRLWRPETEQTRLLRSLCEDRRKAVDARTALCNSMRAKLKEYFPLALQLVGDNLFSELCCALLMKWPRFEAIAAARPDTLRRFYYKQHLRNEEQIQKRLELIAASSTLTSDGAVVEVGIRWVHTMVAQIRSFNRAIQVYDQRIEELFKAHPDGFIFASFPGAGKQLAPRLVAVFGTDRDRHATAVNVATYSGVAPVIQSSGNQRLVRWRWHAPTFLRQSLVEFASQSMGGSTWAKVYYHEQIARGKDHHAAVRALAFKWLRILFRCWKDRTPYDETKYMAALKKHGSWIADAIKKTA